MAYLLWITGVLLFIAGLVLISRGLVGRTMINRELSGQKIIFPVVDELPDDLSTGLSRYAGRPVLTGEQARAYAVLIDSHVGRVTRGRTYAEITEEWQAGKRADKQLTELRETAFKGQTLRGSLLGAYQAWQVTLLVIGLGGLFLLVGLVFMAMGGAWHRV